MGRPQFRTSQAKRQGGKSRSERAHCTLGEEQENEQWLVSFVEEVNQGDGEGGSHTADGRNQCWKCV